MTEGEPEYALLVICANLALHFRINWSGQALSTFYASVRKALVVVIVARALSIIFGFALAGWWIFTS